jgi:3-hydroxy-9,10-secoandrosta-1,3,5(10)-triene-9,17-dione monooxygenase reductase component
VDGRALRQVLRSVPTSVAVVCTLRDATPAGHTIGTFVSVSLDPPLVGYLAMPGSETLEAVRRSRAFSVNVLGAHQAELGRRFAQRSSDRPDRFAGVAWRPGPNGCPHLPGAVALLDCDLHDVLTVGDHELVLGLVTAATTPSPDGPPLVFSGGRFTTPGEPAAPAPVVPAWERAG